jgi:hypothetical protein
MGLKYISTFVQIRQAALLGDRGQRGTLRRAYTSQDGVLDTLRGAVVRFREAQK